MFMSAGGGIRICHGRGARRVLCTEQSGVPGGINGTACTPSDMKSGAVWMALL